MESEEADRKSVCARKRTRKRPYTRKASLSTTFINMAEARREIFNALKLHRSSSSSSSSVRNSAVSYNSNYHQLQLTDSMPAPEPTWSTTAPTVICAPVPAVELLEVEWFDNVSAASYTWWMGFLSSLDRKKTGDESAPGLVAVGKSGSDWTDPNPLTDEWVVFPPADECAQNV